MGGNIFLIVTKLVPVQPTMKALIKELVRDMKSTGELGNNDSLSTVVVKALMYYYQKYKEQPIIIDKEEISRYLPMWETKTEKLSFRLSEAEQKNLIRFANENGKKQTEVLYEAIFFFMKFKNVFYKNDEE